MSTDSHSPGRKTRPGNTDSRVFPKKKKREDVRKRTFILRQEPRDLDCLYRAPAGYDWLHLVPPPPCSACACAFSLAEAVPYTNRKDV